MYELNQLEKILEKRKQSLAESMIVRRGNFVYESPHHREFMIRSEELSVVLSAIHELKEISNAQN